MKRNRKINVELEPMEATALLYVVKQYLKTSTSNSATDICNEMEAENAAKKIREEMEKFVQEWNGETIDKEVTPKKRGRPRKEKIDK